MDFPPVPVAWNTRTSYPLSSSASRARVTQGVVTPNIVAATSGRPSSSCGAGARTMPAIAAAALARIRDEIELMPATSVTDAIIITSTPPT